MNMEKIKIKLWVIGNCGMLWFGYRLRLEIEIESCGELIGIIGFMIRM